MQNRVKILLTLSLASALYSPAALCAEAQYQPVYSEASQRAPYSDENLVIANAAVAHLNAARYAAAVEQTDVLLSRPGLNPYEISNTNYLKSAALGRLAMQDRANRETYQLEKLKAHAAAINARGLLAGEYEMHVRDVTLLLKILDDEEHYGMFAFTHKAVSAPRPDTPEAFLDSKTSGYCGVQFGLTDTGKTQDVKAVCTDDILYDVAVGAVKTWRFEAASDDPYNLPRRNVTRQIYFKLYGPDGKMLRMAKGSLFATYE